MYSLAQQQQGGRWEYMLKNRRVWLKLAVLARARVLRAGLWTFYSFDMAWRTLFWRGQRQKCCKQQ